MVSTPVNHVNGLHFGNKDEFVTSRDERVHPPIVRSQGCQWANVNGEDRARSRTGTAKCEQPIRNLSFSSSSWLFTRYIFLQVPGYLLEPIFELRL